MLLNHNYTHDDKKTVWEHWRNCPAFSRESSRASCDFIPALLYASGRTAQQAMEDWSLTEAQTEALGRLEHLRWCAFHYCQGYRAMTAAEWEERAKQYRQEISERGVSSVRIGRDLNHRTHACLIDWNDLPSLDARESAVTGKVCDYRKADIDNVLLIPELLRAEEGGKI